MLAKKVRDVPVLVRVCPSALFGLDPSLLEGSQDLLEVYFLPFEGGTKPGHVPPSGLRLAERVCSPHRRPHAPGRLLSEA